MKSATRVQAILLRYFGRALKDFANRDEVVIATKVHGKMQDGPNGAGLSRKAILSEIDKSLKRLGTDYGDLYLIHRWDYQTPVDHLLSLEAIPLRGWECSSLFPLP